MAQEKLNFEHFLSQTNVDRFAFTQDLHNYLLENGCKATFEEKKTSLLGSYKHTKTKKTIINLLLREQGLFVRIYGENLNTYRDFLETLTAGMIANIQEAGVCKRLAHGTCSPKCAGYDFTIGGEHFQKCRYSCFEFLVTDESAPYIRAFVEKETAARVGA